MAAPGYKTPSSPVRQKPYIPPPGHHPQSTEDHLPRSSQDRPAVHAPSQQPWPQEYTTHYHRPHYLDIRVHATPYSFTANHEPLFIQYGTNAADAAAHAVWHIGSGYTYAPASGAIDELGGTGFGQEGGKWHRGAAEVGRERGRREVDRDEGAGGGMGRITWTEELHNEFLRAVDIIGVEQAVPMEILKRMRVDGLTREQVASHLQKHRSTLRKEREGKERELLVRAFAKNVLGGEATEEAVLVAVREREEGDGGADGRGKRVDRKTGKKRGRGSAGGNPDDAEPGVGEEQEWRGKRLRRYLSSK